MTINAHLKMPTRLKTTIQEKQETKPSPTHIVIDATGPINDTITSMILLPWWWWIRTRLRERTLLVIKLVQLVYSTQVGTTRLKSHRMASTTISSATDWLSNLQVNGCGTFVDVRLPTSTKDGLHLDSAGGDLPFTSTPEFHVIGTRLITVFKAALPPSRFSLFPWTTQKPHPVFWP